LNYIRDLSGTFPRLIFRKSANINELLLVNLVGQLNAEKDVS
jgi:hypothetical protein